MEHFKIYTLLHPSTPEEKKILLTNSHNLSSAATFDEVFSLGKHDESNLSFSMAEFLPTGEKNPYLELLLPESVIALELEDRPIGVSEENPDVPKPKLIKYKVKGRQPRFTQNQTIWDFSCEDYARAVYSKEAQGLFIDQTGTLQELTEEILGISRKNTEYENLNIDLTEEFKLADPEAAGFINRPPYTTFNSDSLSYFASGGQPANPLKRFFVSSKMVPGLKYDFQFDLLNASFQSGAQTVPVRMAIGVRQYGPTGIELNAEVYEMDDNEPGVSRVINIDFVLHASATSIRVLLFPITLTGWNVFTGPGNFNISAANFKIRRNKDHLVDLDETDPLHLNHLENLKTFNSYAGLLGYQDTKMTFTIENSNLYSAIVDLATLFEAEVRFDYEDNAFYYINPAATKFRGYRAHPDINLTAISRPETSEEFVSIMHLRGSQDVNSIIPSVPPEWREYFIKCVHNNFLGTNNFEKYGSEANERTFLSIAQETLIPKIIGYENFYERQEEILRFARQMDKVPNFDGTLYDFKYFSNTGLMTADRYNSLMKILYDDLRKINITTNVKSYQYYTIFSKYSDFQTQMAYYILGINNEKKFQLTSAQKLDITKNSAAPRPYTSAWVSLMNQVNASESQEQDFRDSLMKLLGFTADGLITSEDSFIWNIMNLFGYESLSKNGLTQLLEENNKKIDEKIEEQVSIRDTVNRIQVKIHINTHGHDIKSSDLVSEGVVTSAQLSAIGISGGLLGAYIIALADTLKNKLISLLSGTDDTMRKFFSVTAANPSAYNYENEALQVDLAGYQTRLTRTYDYLGYRESEIFSYPGTLNLEKEFLEITLHALESLSYEFRETTPLYDLLFNKEYEGNLILRKEKILEGLYSQWESYSIEGVYENSDEIDSYGLLEQGLRAFVYFSRPKTEYSISIIEIGAIEGYEKLPLVQVGEKILLGDGLYHSYHENEQTEYLVVTDFRLTLRDPSSLTLSVTQDDETDRLVAEMLKSINLVKIEPYKQKSNLMIPIPQEVNLKQPIGSYQNYGDYEETTEIISNNIQLFKDMYIKPPLYQPINLPRIQ